MLTRLYIDNFRCFVKFEYRPGSQELILGRNGSGKSSLCDAVLLLRQFVVNGGLFDQFLVLGQRTRWLDQDQITFELEVELEGGQYVYRLVIEPWGDPARSRAASETLHLGERPLFEFTDSEVQLYTDLFEPKVAYEFDPHRSALATIIPRGDNKRLIRFKDWLNRFCCFRINPWKMEHKAERPDLYPNTDLSNIAAWYSHLIQDDPKQNAALLADLRESIEDFDFLQLEAVATYRVLVAEFHRGGGRANKIWFYELSDGQRCLICLYMILHFVVAKGGTVVLDEPDNFISLREIQPWLMALSDAIEESHGQVLLISHHPEIINQWAPTSGVQFIRDETGSVRVEKFRGDPDSGLPPAELVARGWDRE